LVVYNLVECLLRGTIWAFTRITFRREEGTLFTAQINVTFYR